MLEILVHEFCTCGMWNRPGWHPLHAQDKTPVFGKITLTQLKINISLLRKRTSLDEDHVLGFTVLHPGVSAASGRIRSANASVE